MGGEGTGGKEARRSTERLRALADTMRAFLRADRGGQEKLDAIAERVTREVADACLVGMAAPDGTVAAVAFDSRDKAAVAPALATFRAHAQLHLRQMGVSMGVIQTGQCAFISDASTEEIARLVAPEFAGLVRQLGVRGLVAVPLEVRGARLGALAIYRFSPDTPPFTEDDLLFIQALGDHAALALSDVYKVVSLELELAERRRAEEEAKTFVALVENSTDFIGMAAFDGRILFVNRAGRKLVGLDPATDVRSLRLQDFHDDDALARSEIIQREGTWHGDGHLKHFSGGAAIPTRVSSFVVRDARGEPLCFATVQQDVRATQALETRLRQAQRMEAIGRLAGGIAHDFNNMLSVILSYGEMLAPAFPEGSTERADVLEIVLAGQRAAGLTRQLLAFSRQQVLEPRVLDLNAVVSGLHPMLRRSVSEDIEIRTELAAGLARVDADLGQIEQVTLNLVVNARDAMPAGGAVTIATANVVVTRDDFAAAAGTPPGVYVMLAVRDEGVGMDEPTKSRVFEPFFSTKAVGKGTGLGLATVLGIVKQSGGHVLVDSEPGEGATFRVYLPAVDRDVAFVRGSPSVPVGRPTGGSEAILLVDDEPQVRALMRNVLRRAGYEVLEAVGPEEALAAAEVATSEIRLLVTDVIMPRMSGRLLAERIVAARPRTRVLFVSGYTEDVIGSRGVLEPGIHLLRKPLTPEGLLLRVRAILDEPWIY